jgi:hypothetical protein
MKVPPRLDLDHCPARGRGLRPAAALALLACSLAGISVLRYGDLRDAAQEIEDQAARAVRHTGRQAARERGAAAAQAEAALALAVRRALGQPWDQMFTALEASMRQPGAPR